MLNKYAFSRALRLHMPGHKGKMLRFSAKEDITELDFSDNLACPDGVIARSERLFAEQWGAKRAFYLVGGSSVGVMAMLASAKGSVLMQRSSHNSAYNAARIFNKTAYIYNDYGADMLPGKIGPRDIERAAAEHSDIGTVFLTSPDYYGRVLELDAIAELCRTKKLLLFVDSAHGAHFGLNPVLPPPAHKFADAAVISTHKTLPALTQTAVLLTNGDGIAAELRQIVNSLTTTSPSYLLLASIDFARAYAFENRGKYTALQKASEEFFSKLPDGVLRLPSDDFTRVALDVSALGITGFEAQKLLSGQNVFVEFADKKRIVAIFSICDGRRTFVRYLRALKRLPRGTAPQKGAPDGVLHTFDKITRLCFNGKVKYVGLSESEGMTAATNAGLTPPCTPVIVAGEKIQRRQIDMLSEGDVFGLAGGKIAVADE